MPRVTHFELGVSDPARAADFYRSVFGWKIERWGEFDYWLVTTGSEGEPGINGALMVHRDAQPRTVNTIQVNSIEEAAEKVLDAGGQVVTDKVTIPNFGYNLFCKDTEGNLFGLHQFDPQAR
jgi:predicted enzyme related to lactoylglutathione lyase